MANLGPGRGTAWMMAFLLAGIAGCAGPGPDPEPTPTPASDVLAATTDESGWANLTLEGQPTRFHYVDADTGEGIPGLVVGVGLDEGSRAVGTLLALDPLEQYNASLAILHGTVEESSVDGSLQQAGIRFDQASAPAKTTVDVKVARGPRAAVFGIELPQLRKVGAAVDKATEVAGLLGAAAYQVDQYAQLVGINVVGERLGALPGSTSETVDRATARQRVESAAVNDVMWVGLGTVGALMAAGVIGPIGAAAGVTYAALEIANNYLRVQQCQGQVKLTTVAWGAVTLIRCIENPETPPPPTSSLKLDMPDAADVVAYPDVPTGLAYPCRGSSLDCVLPPGDYELDKRAPGKQRTTTQVNVTGEGGRITLPPLAAAPVATLRLRAHGTTGFLAPGTHVSFSITLVLADGTERACAGAALQVYNPVGDTVATASGDGIVAGPDEGAARVVARCDGRTSNPVLVSTKAEGDTATPSDQGGRFRGDVTISLGSHTNPAGCVWALTLRAPLTVDLTPAGDGTSAGSAQLLGTVTWAVVDSNDGMCTAFDEGTGASGDLEGSPSDFRGTLEGTDGFRLHIDVTGSVSGGVAHVEGPLTATTWTQPDESDLRNVQARLDADLPSSG